VQERQEKKQLTPFRSFVLIVALTALGLAAVGAVVALFPPRLTRDAAAPVAGNTTPQVRQLDRESLRSGGRNTGP